jgi:murein DD-endopeptidase MepM/ murein hydrolase activator NlpD
MRKVVLLSLAGLGVIVVVVVVVALSIALRRSPRAVQLRPTLDAASAADCGRFDFPVGSPEAGGYYDAQPFGTNNHLGNDWNGNGGGNSDLGDPVYAISPGLVSIASDHAGGWGNVVRIVHTCRDDPEQEVESLYAHLDTIEVRPGQRVLRGQRLGTIGTAHGQYLAHLHLELRAHHGMPLGGGYSKDQTGYLDPSAFIRGHR